jgi:hypothetical protein
MSDRHGLVAAVTLCLAAVLAAVPASAQTSAGSLTGLVLDTSGAAVANASIAVADLERGTTVRAVSNENGFYVVSQLPPGQYQVTAEREGFRKYVLMSLTIATQQKAALDITLEVGAVTESITVTGEAQLIDTSTATLSGVV